MIDAAICAKYAKAFLDIAKQDNAVDKTEKDLTVFANTVKEHPYILRFFEHPTISRDEKIRFLDEILKNSNLSGKTCDFLCFLVKKKHIHRIECICSIYRDMSLMLEERLQVDVETASALSLRIKKILKQRLSSIYKKDINMRITINPELLAGLKARVGDTVYDLTLRKQLERLKLELL